MLTVTGPGSVNTQLMVSRWSCVCVDAQVRRGCCCLRSALGVRSSVTPAANS